MRRWSLPWVRPTLPPAIDAIFEARLDELTDPNEVRTRFERGLRQTLVRETGWAVKHFPYTTQFRTHPNEKQLNIVTDVETVPFGPFTGVCPRHDCRVSKAQRLATLIGLYADKVVLHDGFSEWFTPNIQIDWETIVSDLRALHEMKPLIADGTIVFASPRPRVCKACFGKYRIEAQDAAEALVEHLAPYVIVTKAENDGHIRVEFNLPDTEFLAITTKFEQEGNSANLRQTGLKVLKKWLVRRALKDYVPRAIAHQLRGVLVSEDVIHLLQIKFQHDAEVNFDSLSEWEAQRSVRLPWLESLSVAQIAQLRREADRALPKLRELLAIWSSQSPSANISDAVCALQESVIEVDIELDALNRKRERWFANTVGTTALSFILYGTAVGVVQPSMAVSTLLGLVGVLHGLDRTDAREEVKLKSRPAYALLRAKRLSDHDIYKDHKRKQGLGL